MSIKALLESKRRRTVDVPVLISDPSTDHEALVQASAAVVAARSQQANGSVQEMERLQQEAVERVQAHWVMVTLQALPSEEWEAVASTYQGDDGLDWKQALPILLAASCVDEELQDEAWWRERLVRPEWSEGDVSALRLGLMQLNVAAAEPTIPKG